MNQDDREDIMEDVTDAARRRMPGPFKGEFPIVVEGLVNSFGEHVIHDDLALKVKRGEIIGVVGGSGTGK